jgi:hypothetical protein
MAGRETSCEKLFYGLVEFHTPENYEELPDY